MTKTKGLALDLDETLSDTALQFFIKLQEKFGNPDKLTPKQALQKYRYASKCPYYQIPPIEQWRFEQVNSSTFQEDLPLIRGADRYVKKIHQEIMPIKMYLTIRPECVIEGTQKWLDKHNFPKAPIITRPDTIQFYEGHKWKAEQLQSLYPEIEGIVDDNASLIHALPKHYQGKIFLFDHDTAPKTNLTVIPCVDWPTVYQKLCELYLK